MEAVVEPTTQNGQPEEHDGQAQATRAISELFRYSAYINVGAGAQECEHDRDGKCRDRAHFHCWLTLPNTFQIRDINEKARSAKARRRRALMDTESDVRVILEEQLEAWTLTDQAYAGLLELIAQRNVERQLQEIVAELNLEERFENRAQDLEEYRRLLEQPEAERDPDDWARLQQDVKDFGDEFEARRQARLERERQALSAEPRDKVLQIEREWQIDEISSEFFLHVYYTWAYYVCARVPSMDGPSLQRSFKTPEDLRGAAPEVITALRLTYRSLESLLATGRGDAAGN